MRPGALLGEAVGRPDGVVDVDVGQRSRSRQQRCLPAQVDRQPGRDRVELTDITKGERAQERPSVKGARTPSDSRGIPPWRSSAMSSMQSAPATIPATKLGIFRPALTPPGLSIRRCSATSF